MPQPEQAREHAPLLELARPSLYRANAFRIAGLDVDCLPSAVNRQAQRLQMAKKWGATDASLVGLLPLNPAPSLSDIEESGRHLADPERRLLQELFWFWPDEGTDSQRDPAFGALRRGDLNSARAIWLRRIDRPEDTVALHNLAVLAHLEVLDLGITHGEHKTGELETECGILWSAAWQYWTRLLSHDPFWARFLRRARELSDPRLTPELCQLVRDSLASALIRVNVTLAVRYGAKGDFQRVSEQVQVLRRSGIHQRIIERLIEQAMNDARDRVHLLCGTAETEAQAHPEQASQCLQKLLQDSKQIRESLNLLLGAGNALRDSIHDQLARAGKACVVAYANKTENWRVCRSLLNDVLRLAVSGSVRRACQSDLDTVNEHFAHYLADLIVGLCQSACQRVEASPECGEQTIRTLISDVHGRLNELRGATNPHSAMLTQMSDYAALAVRNCIVDYGNATRNWCVCVALLGECRRLAVSPETIKRVDEDLGTVQANAAQGPYVPNFTIPGNSRSPAEPLPAAPRDAMPIWARWSLALLVVVVVILLIAFSGSSDEEALRRRKSSLDACKQTLQSYSTLIDEDRQQLRRMESANSAGLYVDELEYDRVLARHNSNVPLHNAQLSRCRSLAADYNRMVSQR